MKLANREYGKGRPLIILHGLFGQSDNWNTLGKQFAEKNLHVFLPDQRNHGLSPHSDEWTYEAMAGDLKEFIDEHSLEDPILMGHSMGAKTVLFFQHKFPEVSSKLIIADMAARAYGDHHRIVLEALNAVDFSKIRNRKEAEKILNEYISDFGTKQFLLKNIYWKHQEEGIMDWRFNLKVITEHYSNVSEAVPFYRSGAELLVLSGSKSDYINESDIEDYKNRFANSKFQTIEGAGHWLHAEKPQEFYKAVADFIES